MIENVKCKIDIKIISGTKKEGRAGRQRVFLEADARKAWPNCSTLRGKNINVLFCFHFAYTSAPCHARRVVLSLVKRREGYGQ